MATSAATAGGGVPPQSIRGSVTLHPIRALELVVPYTFLARGGVGFIIPLFPRRAPEGSALGVPHRAALVLLLI